MSIETFKPAFAGWLAYRELGDFAKVWHDKPLQEDAPSWAAAALYIEEGGLSGVFNLGDTEMWTEFENLLTKHKVWWEMEDSCWIWLYPEGTFDGVGKERTLESAKALLLKLAKHGDGDLAEAAETAAEAVGDTINHLLKPEPAGA